MLHIGPYLGTGHTFHPGSLLDGVHRAVASMYSWGGGGGWSWPKNSEYFMAYEATKVFAIRKMKTRFTNKNTHILRTDILLKVACSAIESFFDCGEIFKFRLSL